jgi:1-aminocyclopropane-1-carboxylate deaminase/D-cysteine desulfhydrase-like pyridoxal-dependent ACC family enzyme
MTTPKKKIPKTDAQFAIKYNKISGGITILACECEIIKKSSITITQKLSALKNIQKNYNTLFNELKTLHNIQKLHPSYDLSQKEFIKIGHAIKKYAHEASELDIHIINDVSPHNFNSPHSTSN